MSSKDPSDIDKPLDTVVEETTIDSLVDDCLIHIFEFLPLQDKIKIERVSKRWSQAVKQSWSHMKKLALEDNLPFPYPDVSQKQRLENFYFISTVLERCGNYINEVALETFKESKFLEYHFYIALLARHCKNLTSVTLSDNTEERILTDEVLKILFKSFDKLSCVSLFIMPFINGSCLLKLHPDNIKEFTVFECGAESAENIFNFLPTLRNLNKLAYHGDSEVVSKSIDALNQSKSKIISEIILQSGNFMFSINLSTFLFKQKNLRKLNLTNVATTFETEENLLADTLEDLSLDYNKNDFPESMINSLKYTRNLQRIDLTFNKLNNNYIKLIAESINTNIKKIEITYTEYDNSSYQLGTDVLSELKKLEFFEITKRNSNIKSGNIDNILLALSKCKNVKNCVISHCEVTETGLRSLGSFPELRILNITDKLLLDKECIEIINNCSHLEEVRLLKCKKKDASIIKMKYKDVDILRVNCDKCSIRLKPDFSNLLSVYKKRFLL